MKHGHTRVEQVDQSIRIHLISNLLILKVQLIFIRNPNQDICNVYGMNLKTLQRWLARKKIQQVSQWITWSLSSYTASLTKAISKCDCVTTKCRSRQERSSRLKFTWKALTFFELWNDVRWILKLEFESIGKLCYLVLWTDQALTKFDSFEILSGCKNRDKNSSWHNLSFDFVKRILVLSAIVDSPDRQLRINF